MDEKKTKIPAETPASMRGLLHGIYRRLGEIRDLLREGRATVRAPEQLALPLPGMPAENWAPPGKLPPKPREWCNSVRAYDALWTTWKDRAFDFGAMLEAEPAAAIREATNGRLSPASFTKLLSVLVRAGAAKRDKRFYALVRPDDTIREAVEAMAARRTKVAALAAARKEA